ncbi:MAG: phosphopentomutase [candidate division Zixibacteria bacterium]|nr:phosphopentomutase [candidate division Zixibacteria bacterium]
MIKYKRICLIILDACGVGELPDAADYGDAGSNTIGNCAKAVGGLNMPNMADMGLGNIIPIEGVPPSDKPKACYGKMAEQSVGKDSTVGHWELAGIISKKPFPVYPDGFPDKIIEEFKMLTGHGILGNIPASGTEIIAKLGEKHIKTGDLIVYTSADSVFQIAAHTDVVPLDKLYHYCQFARDMLVGENAVARVIARPFTGKPGAFVRTSDRKDFSVAPPVDTILDKLKNAGYDVVTIGKVDYLFAGKGITRANHTKSNEHGIKVIISQLAEDFKGLLFANLVDFDMLWGHRNNYVDFAKGLEYFDSNLPRIISSLKNDDLLIITADHGCDPTTVSTDHSREYVPLIAYSPSFEDIGGNLGIRKTFADLASTIAEIFNIENFSESISFASELK